MCMSRPACIEMKDVGLRRVMGVEDGKWDRHEKHLEVTHCYISRLMQQSAAESVFKCT